MQVGGKQKASAQQVPRLGPGVDPARLALTPTEGYLLSRIDGRTSWGLLRQIGGLPAQDVDRCIERWLGEGVLVVGNEGPAREAGAATAGERAPAAVAKAPAADSSELDPCLDIPLELQRRILDFAGRLDAPYHEILGVARDADRKALRHAYFQLSKELHPDRYFRRNLGPFAKRLERVFGKVVEAYELLSDPTARAEIERSLAAATPADMRAAPAASAQAASDAPPEAASPAAPRRRPHVFSVPSRVLKARKARAKRFFESGMAAYNAGRWLEAAGAVRLAIAHDPWSAVYKEDFVEVQSKAHDERARQLVKEAESALELRDYAAALRSFEEALHDRPHDPELLRRTAKLAFASGGDLHQAKEWAAASVEIEPRDAGAHRLLGQIFKAAGLEANARREFETALQLDPKDEESRAELRASGPLQALRRLGGKRWVG